MPDRNGAGGVTAIAGFIVAVIAIALLALSGEIFARQPLLMLVQALAVVLMVWARLTFGLRSFNPGAAPTEGELVTTGPYRYWRHPIYAAVIIFVATAAVSHATWRAAALALTVAGGLYLRMRSEERLLARRYADYRAYAARTARVIPGLF
ncbi:MAG TPA: isoprenylcysteine carboxylmethyltransferase family protein [Vicinamibacterales bacterium]|jgi:protein-S-isoprenylcysteine O-methyltransferase Ste14|nr:isoprenylcysteine carboxylmethyltransferase family protein [Vicinamibacterales bacterium]